MIISPENTTYKFMLKFPPAPPGGGGGNSNFTKPATQLATISVARARG